MSTNLIAHLKKKCEEDDNVKILLSQWEFDQKLVGKALENIGGFYPHFSNHNASHSQQILVNIERILGNDIELLSATDTWLILEAAYWHDIGMLVDAKSAKEVHENEDFKFMVKMIAQDKGHDLNEFCSAYEEGDWVSAIGSEEHPFDGVEKYRQLIAEWFRRNHDKRIGGLVEDPFKFLNITSPRTELLPKRIYRYLGQICMSHGMKFTDVLETLPFKQTGLGTENCHPRFIGCLLRLGDLFDLDDNRFCPVMAKHVSNIPSISKHHHDKHLSLREFQLDRRIVKLVAECPTEMAYIETQNWFGWIREEFQNQMSLWNLIVPNQSFGSLPTIEHLEVRMQIKNKNGVKSEKILLNNKPMKFTLDEKNAMELLQGANLYSNELSIFRELIQNSIDATMLHIWLEEDQNRIKDLHPYHKEFIEICKRYPITIDLKKIESKVWEITLKDRGVGISLNDLNYIQKMAGSNKNIEKRKIINNMPIWMRPSGEFGIGLHSAFLLAKNLEEDDKSIKISTMSYFSNDLLKIEMNSPLGGKGGYCFIERTDGVKRKIGTELTVRFSSDLNLINHFLNILDLDDNYGLAKIKYYSNLLRFNILKNTPFFSDEKDGYMWDYERNLAYKFSIRKDESSGGATFRGQTAFIGEHNIRSHILDFHIDYYGILASDTLNVSRDVWKQDYVDTISKDIEFYSKKYIEKSNTIETHFIDKLMGYNLLSSDEWKEYNIEFDNGGLCIKNIFNENIVFIESEIFEFIKCELNIEVKCYFMSYNNLRVVRNLFEKQYINELKNIKIYESICLVVDDEEIYEITLFFISFDGAEPPVISSYIKVKWEEYSKQKGYVNEYNVEDTLYSMIKKIQYNLNNHEEITFIMDVNLCAKYKNLNIFYKRHNRIICPYQIKDNKIILLDPSQLTDFVLDHKDVKDISLKNEIYTCFEKLIFDINEIVENNDLRQYF